VLAKLGNTYQMERLFTVILAVMGEIVPPLVSNLNYGK